MSYQRFLIDQNILQKTLKFPESAISKSVYEKANSYSFSTQTSLNFNFTPLGLIEFLGVNFKDFHDMLDKEKTKFIKEKDPEIFWNLIQEKSFQIVSEFISISILEEYIKKLKPHSENFNNILDNIEKYYLNNDKIELIKISMAFELSISFLETLSFKILNQNKVTYLLQWVNSCILDKKPIPFTRLAYIIMKKSEIHYKINKQDPLNNSEIERMQYIFYKDKIKRLMEIEGTSFKRTNDLLDSEIIHSSILGFLGKNKTLIFTGDKPEVIKNRIHIYLHFLIFIDFTLQCNNQKSIFNESRMGSIFCLNQKDGVVQEEIEILHEYQKVKCN